MVSKGQPKVDVELWPVVVITLSGELQRDDYRALCESIERLSDGGQPYLVVADLRGVTKLGDAARREEIAQSIMRMEAQFGDLILGSIIVVRSAILRGSLLSLHWLLAKERPDGFVLDGFVLDMRQALVLAEQKLRARAVSVPPGLASLLSDTGRAGAGVDQASRPVARSDASAAERARAAGRCRVSWLVRLAACARPRGRTPLPP